MKKKLTALLALVFALVFLCGSALPNGWFRADGSDEVLRFDDMPYERPDAAAFRGIAEKTIRTMRDGGGYRRTVAMLDELFSRYYSMNTMASIADIRSCRNLADEYWAAEYAACLSALTEIGDIMEDVYLACGASPYGERLEREYFGPGFMAEYGENAEEKLSEAFTALAEQENALLVEYRNTVAEPMISVHGVEVPLYDVMYDVWGQRDYDNLMNAYYEKYNPILGDLYLRLMSVRKAQAKELGYGSYAEMMFDIGFDRDYSVEEGRAFIESVKRWIVPAYARLMDGEKQAELLEGYISDAQLYGALETVARGFGGEIGQAYDFMRRNSLSDLTMSDSKADMSFTTYLDDYEAPFLFVDPYGDRSDIVTVTHEFGHYAEAYISCNAYRSMDLAEVFSQAMQLLSLRPLRDVLGEQGVEQLRLLNMYEFLDTFLWQTLYAEFELRAYALENPRAADLNALMWELYKEYGLDTIWNEESAVDWIDITHFFEQPFYVISYPVSACCALELYERELQESGKGLESYLQLADSDQIGIVEAAGEAGLQNPITDARVQQVAAFLEGQLAG